MSLLAELKRRNLICVAGNGVRPLCGLLWSLLALSHIAAAQQVPNAEVQAAMTWAFPQNPPAKMPVALVDDKTPMHVPGSARTFTAAQTTNISEVADWWPQDHPPMPGIVARARGPTWPCAYCHLPNGQGRPENSALAGLPAAYIVAQVHAFRGGERKAGVPEMAKYMPVEARNVSDADLKTAAEYFSSLRFKKWTRVIETAMVPKTQFEHFMLVPIEGAGREPIGSRIIEIAQNLKRTELRDARSGFIAYVPPGSIARGKVMATRGDSKTQACVACHGAGLHGAGVIPPLAGRSPTYIVRQLIQFQDGGRSGAATLPMQAVVARLTVDDMIALAAYAASRAP
ncbi:MAG: c-type cytochrome [Rudaea sp.]